MRYIIILFFIYSSFYAADLEKLLQQYNSSSKKSLQTLDEKMGHVIVYTQDELQLMQYQRLSDLLLELPMNNFSTNRFGTNNLSLSGNKTEATGFFRLYINDHEVSSMYNASPSTHWLNMPISLIDHVEVYYGEGSFTLGNTTGIEFIRVYTKDAKKENGNVFESFVSNKSSNLQSYTHSMVLKNGWSYLFHASNQNTFQNRDYNGEKIKNDASRNYLFATLKNEKNSIDIGYSDLQKDNYSGYSTDLVPNEGSIDSTNYFLHMSNYHLSDNSLKTTFSIDKTEYEYSEKNDELMYIVPILDLTNPPPQTMPKEFYENVEYTKINALVSKQWQLGSHKLFGALNFKDKRYKTKERTYTNLFNTFVNEGKYNSYDNEQIYSLMLQEDYEVNKNLHLLANFKVDKYNTDSAVLQDDTQNIYRFGTIYLPTQNLGFKAFYTKSYIPPTFFNIDFADKSKPAMKTQEYEYYTVESAYTFGKSKINLDLYNVHIENFIYYTPVGFINIADEIRTKGFIFDYEYIFDENNKLKLNYHLSRLNQSINNSNEGGYIKYMGRYKKYEYFTSLLYRKGYNYYETSVGNSYNLNFGLRYNYTKDLSFSIKANNILDKPTKSLATDTSTGLKTPSYPSFEDYDRSVTVGVRWVF